MVTFPMGGFVMKFYFNDSDNDAIDDESFVILTVKESISALIYDAELILTYETGLLLRLNSAEKLKIVVEPIPCSPNVTAQTPITTMKFIVGGTTLDRGKSKTHLYSGLSPILMKNNINKGYRGSVADVMRSVGTTIGVSSSEIDTVTANSRVFLQCNESYLRFMRRLSGYASVAGGGLSSGAQFCAFIDKSDKLYFKNVGQAAATDPILSTLTDQVSSYRLDVNRYAMGIQGGYGLRYGYFDWDSGEYVTDSYEFESRIAGKKFGVNRTMIDDNNRYLALGTVAAGSGSQPIYPVLAYNKNRVENYVLRKNYFNVSFSAFIKGDFALKPLKKIKLMHIFYGEGLDEYLSNEYLIFSITHMFSKDGFVAEIHAFVNGNPTSNSHFLN